MLRCAWCPYGQGKEYLNDVSLNSHILKDHNKNLIETAGTLVCTDCLLGAHKADEYSVPDCSVVGCSCCCEG